jgi:hypothetical protein
MLLFLKEEKKISWVLMTQVIKSLSVSYVRKKLITRGTVFSLRNGLKRKRFLDVINLRKGDEAIRVANAVKVNMKA